eukprot:TRINITY_DN1060_c0_g1_i1.p1 TRINITY_DN1060_c0_g1~~TRINITY_DN1060_c0_g1_i1.p1  ORF type:complete len:235 (+),score=85.62 TRINITY_DN1060_c0_g1_i1:224-928(+)
MTTLGSDLIWGLIKKHNSFIVRRNGVSFSRESNNLMNLNSYKFSGIARNKAVGVNIHNKIVTLTTKKSKHAKAVKPIKSILRTRLRHHYRKGALTIIRRIRGYRPDLLQFALARFHVLHHLSRKINRPIIKRVPKRKLVWSKHIHVILRKRALKRMASTKKLTLIRKTRRLRKAKASKKIENKTEVENKAQKKTEAEKKIKKTRKPKTKKTKTGKGKTENKTQPKTQVKPEGKK